MPGPETRTAICDLNAGMLREAKGERAAAIRLKRRSEIPGWLLVSCVRSDDEVRQREDLAACCCAVQNLMLYLWVREIGVKWTTGDVTRSAEFLQITGVDPVQESIVGLFWYGRAQEVPAAVRRPINEVKEQENEFDSFLNRCLFRWIFGRLLSNLARGLRNNGRNVTG